MMWQTISDVLLVEAVAAVTALALLYLLLQPWWQSWFGISMVMMMVSAWQAGARGVLVLALGPEYEGGLWVMLGGRLVFATGATIAAVGLGRQLVGSYRAPRAAGRPPGARRRGPNGS